MDHCHKFFITFIRILRPQPVDSVLELNIILRHISCIAGIPQNGQEANVVRLCGLGEAIHSLSAPAVKMLSIRQILPSFSISKLLAF
jgi:hypothetical protein